MNLNFGFHDLLTQADSDRKIIMLHSVLDIPFLYCNLYIKVHIYFQQAADLVWFTFISLFSFSVELKLMEIHLYKRHHSSFTFSQSIFAKPKINCNLTI